MARKKNLKQYAKSMGKYEGRQYQGGRQPGRKNLTRVDGGYKNQYGVTFTQEQKEALERAVNRSNYQRKKQLAEVDKLNPQHSQLRLMGKESDFIITRQSKSLQRFKTMEEFEKYLDKQDRISSGEYLDDKTRLYKRNYMASLDKVFGDDAADVKMKVRMMKPEEYRKLVEKDELLEINYVYDPSARAGKLNQIRASLGMKPKEEDLFSELEE